MSVICDLPLVGELTKAVKERVDLISSTRYAIMMRRSVRQSPSGRAN
jgi:hypothetical protein